MANYYRVSPKFWLWARRRNLTDAQTALAFYLLTTSHRNLEGLYRLPKPYIAADLGWPAKKVDETLATILATGFAVYDEATEMVLIPKALKHQSPNTKLQVRGAVAQLERIPRTSLWHAFVMACQSHCPPLFDAIAERWPSDSNTRAGAISSSTSSSISTPPLTPPASPGGNSDESAPAPQVRANARALGTNPRAVGQRQAEDAAESAAHAAVSAITDASNHDRGEWGRLQRALQDAVGDGSTWALYVEPLGLAGVRDGVLVLDGPPAAWTWHRAPRLIERCCEVTGVRARLASSLEHEGFEVAA